MRLLTIFLFVFLVSTGAAFAGSAYKTIDMKGLQELQASGEEFVLIDSRGKNYLFSKNVIDGAVHIPVNEQDAESLSKAVPSKDTKIVFYCSNTSCPASAKAAAKAKQDGYNNLYKYPGGYDEWKDNGGAISKL